MMTPRLKIFVHVSPLLVLDIVTKFIAMACLSKEPMSIGLGVKLVFCVNAAMVGVDALKRDSNNPFGPSIHYWAPVVLFTLSAFLHMFARQLEASLKLKVLVLSAMVLLGVVLAMGLNRHFPVILEPAQRGLITFLAALSVNVLLFRVIQARSFKYYFAVRIVCLIGNGGFGQLTGGVIDWLILPVYPDRIVNLADLYLWVLKYTLPLLLAGLVAHAILERTAWRKLDGSRRVLSVLFGPVVSDRV